MSVGQGEGWGWEREREREREDGRESAEREEACDRARSSERTKGQ